MLLTLACFLILCVHQAGHTEKFFLLHAHGIVQLIVFIQLVARFSPRSSAHFACALLTRAFAYLRMLLPVHFTKCGIFLRRLCTKCGILVQPKKIFFANAPLTWNVDTNWQIEMSEIDTNWQIELAEICKKWQIGTGEINKNWQIGLAAECTRAYTTLTSILNPSPSSSPLPSNSDSK